jgi:hypothetical protein
MMNAYVAPIKRGEEMREHEDEAMSSNTCSIFCCGSTVDVDEAIKLENGF